MQLSGPMQYLGHTHTKKIIHCLSEIHVTEHPELSLTTLTMWQAAQVEAILSGPLSRGSRKGKRKKKSLKIN